jgi:hypothetical protein
MKIRTGFVSNSSSSSFCIYGLDLSSDLGQGLLAATAGEGEEEDEYALEEDNISVFGFADCTHYLGRELRSIEDEETFNQFKASVINHIRKLCEKYNVKYENISKNCGIFEEATWDG